MHGAHVRHSVSLKLHTSHCLTARQCSPLNYDATRTQREIKTTPRPCHLCGRNTPMSMLPTGEQMRLLRERQGLSQADLARMAGVAIGTIRRVESGKAIRPKNMHAILSKYSINPCQDVSRGALRHHCLGSDETTYSCNT